MAKAKKITQFTKPILTAFEQDVLKALGDFCATRGLIAETRGGQFGETDYTLKINFAVSENGKAMTYERQMFLKYAKNYGLKPEWLDKTITYKGETYTIVGLKPSNRAPVVCSGGAGGYMLLVDTVREALDPEGFARAEAELAERNARDPIAAALRAKAMAGK